MRKIIMVGCALALALTEAFLAYVSRDQPRQYCTRRTTTATITTLPSSSVIIHADVCRCLTVESRLWRLSEVRKCQELHVLHVVQLNDNTLDRLAGTKRSEQLVLAIIYAYCMPRPADRRC
jgi:hypothetical protein